MNNNNNENVEGKKKYFTPIIQDEEMPIDFDDETNIKNSSLEKIFNLYFKESSLSIAKESSKRERNEKNITDSNFIYGEITFRSMAYIFEYLHKEFGENIIDGNFYDLGSGEGKGIIAAALLHPFKNCFGIEYIEALHNLAVDVEGNYNKTIKGVFDQNKKLFSKFETIPKLNLIKGDFLKQHWENPSVILANSTCFDNELIEKIADKAGKECPSGTIIITFSKGLPNNGCGIEFYSKFRRVMSWGIATVYVHRKI